MFLGAILFLSVYSNNEKSENVNNEVLLEQEQQNIQIKNSKAFEEADAIVFSVPISLKTKQPMNARIIEPFDYETELVGDNAYNRKAYMYAVERLKKNSYIKDNQVYVSVKSGAEI